MTNLAVRVLGCGDAFGSGARFQTSFHIRAGRHAYLLDCGATTLVALHRCAMEPGAIKGVLLSHLHGDHFGGLPFFLLHAQFIGRRTAPLVIVGPQGTRARLEAALEIMFPGSAGLPWRFPLEVVEISSGISQTVGRLQVTGFAVNHPSGAEAFALRLRLGSKVIGYSGDTAWTDALIEVADQADLFISECYSYQGNGKYHLSWRTLSEHAPKLRARRILLCHMSQAMLDKLPELDRGRFEIAEDGLLLEL